MTLSDDFVRFVDPFCAAELGDFRGWGCVAAAAAAAAAAAETEVKVPQALQQVKRGNTRRFGKR